MLTSDHVFTESDPRPIHSKSCDVRVYVVPSVQLLLEPLETFAKEGLSLITILRTA